LRGPDRVNSELVAPDEEEEKEEKLTGWKNNGYYFPSTLS
jgi:hypothetical protein